MPKGQQRGNKEAKKPKKAAAPAPVPALPVRVVPAAGGGPARRPKT